MIRIPFFWATVNGERVVTNCAVAPALADSVQGTSPFIGITHIKALATESQLRQGDPRPDRHANLDPLNGPRCWVLDLECCCRVAHNEWGPLPSTATQTRSAAAG